MTKDTYFEMCMQLGQEPVESEIPLEVSDFPELIQQAFSIYCILKDCWDPMGGSYLGKDYSIVFELFRLYQISGCEEELLVLDFLQHIDGVRGKIISAKQKQKSP